MPMPKRAKPNYRNLEEFKTLIAPLGGRLSDRQLHRLQTEMFELADILLELFLHEEQQVEAGPSSDRILTDPAQTTRLNSKLTE